MVEQADDNSLFVEIGSFQGASTAFMCVEIANSGKNIKFECIDPMIPIGHYQASSLEKPHEFEGYGVDKFHERLISVKDYYKLHQMASFDAHKLYDDQSIDFIMIDGDHSYDGVFKDVTNFLPKMRSGGLMTGDDAYDPEIMRAVRDAIKDLDLEVVSNGLHFFISIP
jgi:predicted O-methyltransferase YrrM